MLNRLLSLVDRACKLKLIFPCGKNLACITFAIIIKAAKLCVHGHWLTNFATTIADVGLIMNPATCPRRNAAPLDGICDHRHVRCLGVLLTRCFAWMCVAVQLVCMLFPVESGAQVAFMAPTEVLAEQHFKSVLGLAKKLNLSVELLTGSTKPKERDILLNNLLIGKTNILIGTHALIEERVRFKKLGLVVIDEQHKFGVAQRAKLWSKKEEYYPHVLVMTATPIPRTLALTLYGDLDVSVIDELPKGRKEIITSHRNDNSRLKVLNFIKQTVESGSQVYIVYPLIEESAKKDHKDLMDGYESLTRYFPDTQIGVLHGRMKAENKDYEMKRFVEAKTKILVSTTVVEVGVDVPNASVIIIESAERFGLSQLHQLRGRVGRGKKQSYCILMTKYDISKESKERIKAMVETSDGFKIANTDLKLRGPGNMMGTKQSGLLELRFTNLAEDYESIKKTRKTAINLIEEDPELSSKENIEIKNYLKNNIKSNINWSRIS